MSQALVPDKWTRPCSAKSGPRSSVLVKASARVFVRFRPAASAPITFACRCDAAHGVGCDTQPVWPHRYAVACWQHFFVVSGQHGRHTDESASLVVTIAIAWRLGYGDRILKNIGAPRGSRRMCASLLKGVCGCRLRLRFLAIRGAHSPQEIARLPETRCPSRRKSSRVSVC